MIDANLVIEEMLRNPHVCDSGVVVNDLLRAFHGGYPIEQLRRLLSSENGRVVKAGVFIASELGVKTAPLRGEVARLLNHPSGAVRFDAIDSLLTCTTAEDEKELASVVLMIDDIEGPVRRKALDFLSRASLAQLHAALRHLENTEPESIYVAGLRSLVAGRGSSADEAFALLRSHDQVLRKYGAAAAARSAVLNPEPLEFASTMGDEDVARFARDRLELLNQQER